MLKNFQDFGLFTLRYSKYEEIKLISPYFMGVEISICINLHSIPYFL